MLRRSSQPLAEPEPVPGAVICPTCSTPNEPGRTFCVKCGARLDLPAPVPVETPTRRGFTVPEGPLVPIAAAGVVVVVLAAIAFSQLGGGGGSGSTATPTTRPPSTAATSTSTTSSETPSEEPSSLPPGIQPASPEAIVFYAVRDGNPDVFVVNADGGGLDPLTSAAGSDSDPAWSPDRTKIAFESHASAPGLPGPEGRYAQIWVMSADGSNAHPLTSEAANSAHATWSPDGNRIAFDSDRGDGKTLQVYVMDADGNNVRRLTGLPGGATLPAWSPDTRANLIAFDALASREIWAVSPDGSDEPKPLVDGHAAYPAWSPDGSRLAFSTTRDGGYQIYLADADGGSMEPLTSGRSHAVNPSWSPDGDRIVFEDGLRKDSQLFIVAASGGDPEPLLPDESDVHRPSWR
ncbi:MAG TPA: hypothetical protein VIV06_04775 [Candidatus Limnocylindrales bacterium]